MKKKERKKKVRKERKRKKDKRKKERKNLEREKKRNKEKEEILDDLMKEKTIHIYIHRRLHNAKLFERIEHSGSR